MENEKKPKPIKVLVVEDDEDDFIIIKDLLLDIHTNVFDLTWAPTYEKTLELLKLQAHDICLLDYRLGAHDGIEGLKEVATAEINIPTIFLTAQGEYEVDVQAMKYGAADYLVKEMLTPSLLERSIRYSLEQDRAGHELRRTYEQLEEKVQQRTAELKAANQEIRKASEKIKLFAYSISHDLKSPATGLLGLTRRFYENYGLVIDEKGRAYCAKIFKTAEQIFLLVEKITIYISAKETPLTIENLSLPGLLTEVKEEFSDRLHQRNIRWQEPVGRIRIRADRLGIIRILRNLVENAIKYGGDSLSRVEIGFDETDQVSVISVSDDGQGLVGNMSDDIFSPFSRMNNARGIEGGGPGLAIVKEIAERHRGEIRVENTPGKGAAFHVSITRAL